MDTADLLKLLASGVVLDEGTAEAAFELVFGGKLDDAQIGAMLGIMQVRGVSADELVGAARVMRRHVTPVPCADAPGVVVLDTCGTGGARKLFNVSTAAALVAAAAGEGRVRVAKHGNRSRTGRGSAEVLSRLGVNVDAAPEVQARCLEQAGICFCFAIHHHPAAKHAAAARRALGFPTIFNLLGPLTNPAGAKRQLIGIYRPELVALMATALSRLGAERAMVVHSDDGLDEISIEAPTRAAHVEGGMIRGETINGPAFVAPHAPGAPGLEARDAEHAAEIIRDVLDGVPGPALEMVVLNSAAALLVVEAVPDLAGGIRAARRAVESGRAKETLRQLAELSRAGV